MDNLELRSEKMKHFENITSFTQCNELCKSEKGCSLWTYFSGACIFKNNMVYTVKNPLVTSGEKYCIDSGTYYSLLHYDILHCSSNEEHLLHTC